MPINIYDYDKPAEITEECDTKDNSNMIDDTDSKEGVRKSAASSASFLDPALNDITASPDSRPSEIEKTMDLELALKDSRQEYIKGEFELAVMEAMQVHQLKLLSLAIAEQEQKYRAELELATRESEIVDVSRIETKEMLRGFEEESANDVQDLGYHAELELAKQESEIFEVSRLEAEERSRLKEIEENSAIDEQDEEYLAQLEFVKQESEIIEVSRLEAEERLKEIEEDILAEVLALTRVANEEE